MVSSVLDFDVGVKEIEVWTARLLPSWQVSCLIDLIAGCIVYGTYRRKL